MFYIVKRDSGYFQKLTREEYMGLPNDEYWELICVIED